MNKFNGYAPEPRKSYSGIVLTGLILLAGFTGWSLAFQNSSPPLPTDMRTVHYLHNPDGTQAPLGRAILNDVAFDPNVQGTP